MEGRQERKEACNAIQGCIVTKTMLLWLLRKKNVSSHYIKNGQQNVSRKLAVEEENSCTLITFKKKAIATSDQYPNSSSSLMILNHNFVSSRKHLQLFFSATREKSLVEPAFPGILKSFESG